MRVLIATSYRRIVGGVETYLSHMAPALSRADCEVAWLFEEPAAAGDIRVDTPLPTAPVWCVGELGVESVMRAIAEFAPDVVYTHGLRSPDLESMLLDRYPAVLYAHGYYGTCATGAKLHAWPRTSACTRVLGASCLPLNYLRGCGFRNPVGLSKAFRLQAKRSALLSRYKAILVASDHMRAEFARHGVAPRRLKVLALPVQRSETLAPSELRAWSNEILFLGRITDIKGLHYLVRAMPMASSELNRPLTLVVAGEGPYLRDVQALAAALHVDVHYAGWVNDSARATLMKRADLLAVPSIWPEPFGLVGIEAATLGLPAVAYDVGGIREWLVPGRSGEIAPATPPSPRGLADAIVRALDDPAHHGELRSGAFHQSLQFGEDRHTDVLRSSLARACAILDSRR